MTTLTDRPDTGRSDGPSGSAHDSRPLVLVVDDEESYRQALASGLSREGFAVEVAGDGHEALRLFHRVHPDLVLLDVMLPDQSGIELCQRMRALAPVPIIMVTAGTPRSTSSWGSSSAPPITWRSPSGSASWLRACAPCSAGGRRPPPRSTKSSRSGPSGSTPGAGR